MSENILTLPNIKLSKDVLLKLRSQARALIEDKLGEVMEDVLNTELSKDATEAYLHLVVSQNIGQAIDLYILCYGKEAAKKHIEYILEARMDAAIQREAGFSEESIIN